MSGNTFSISDSLHELLASLEGCHDQAVLLPVIENLLQELDFNGATSENAYRQLLADLVDRLLQSELLSDDASRQFYWLKKLSLAGHDLSALQALVRQMEPAQLGGQPLGDQTVGDQLAGDQQATDSAAEPDQEPGELPDQLLNQAPDKSFSQPTAEATDSEPRQEMSASATAADSSLSADDSGITTQSLSEAEKQPTRRAADTSPPSSSDLRAAEKLLLDHAPLQQHDPIMQEALDENLFNNNEIKNLKQTLQQRLESTKSQCREFESLMQLLLSDLREANSSSELETIRAMLKRSIQRLLSDEQTISSNIMEVASQLNRFEMHCEQINHELGLVKQLSMTDELTRLPNRRAFLKRLQNESGRVQRYGYPLSVAMLDLDLFKEINDTYGHAVGDEVLKTYTQNVLSTFRNYDLVARYGGEEFAVLLPHTDIYGAERALNKVLQRTAETRLMSPDGQGSIRLPSFSAGVAVYREGESIDSVINRADRAMYSAKKMGRNRVIVEPDAA